MIVNNSNLYKGGDIVLDGQTWDRCVFERCRIIMTRGNFSLTNSEFIDCTFEFRGEAAVIRQMVLDIQHSSKTGGVMADSTRTVPS